MEIKVEIDNARIIRDVMQGMTSKEMHNNIRCQIISELRSRLTQEITSSFNYKAIKNACEKKLNDEFEALLWDAVGKKIDAKGFIKKLCVDSDFSNRLAETIWDATDDAINNGGMKITVKMNHSKVAKYAPSRRK